MSVQKKISIIIVYTIALVGCAGQTIKPQSHTNKSQGTESTGVVASAQSAQPQSPKIDNQKPLVPKPQPRIERRKIQSTQPDLPTDRENVVDAASVIRNGIPFSINFGERRAMQSSTLEWRLHGIKDQRCPLGMVCAQDGAATVTLEIFNKAARLATLTVEDTNFITINNVGVFERYQVEVIKLMPYPTELFVSPRAYVAELVVRKLP